MMKLTFYESCSYLLNKHGIASTREAAEVLRRAHFSRTGTTLGYTLSEYSPEELDRAADEVDETPEVHTPRSVLDAIARAVYDVSFPILPEEEQSRVRYAAENAGIPLDKARFEVSREAIARAISACK